MSTNRAFASIMPADSTLEKLGSGILTEGPVWNASEEYLLFSDVRANRIYQWSEQTGVTVFREPSGHANGLTYDKTGHLVICEHSTRRVAQLDKDGSYTVLVDRFQGNRLNSPNDVVVKSDGAIYFTDPPYGINLDERELAFHGVYRLDPHTRVLTLLTDEFDRPNGLAFAPDEKRLYIADSSERRHVQVWDVEPDGTIRNGQLFAEIRSDVPGNPDGMKVDTAGNLYVVAAGGVWVFSSDGEHLGTIPVPDPRPTNCAWGGNDWRTLFIAARTSVYRVRLQIPGIPVP